MLGNNYVNNWINLDRCTNTIGTFMEAYMNSKQLLSYCRMALACMLFSSFIPLHAESGSNSSNQKLVKVLNPGITDQFADRVPLAERLDTLAGKTIYLVDDNWGGMGENGILHDEIEAWFAQHIPDVKIVRKVKRGNFVTDDPALWKEIADNGGDGVIIGVAG